MSDPAHRGAGTSRSATATCWPWTGVAHPAPRPDLRPGRHERLRQVDAVQGDHGHGQARRRHASASTARTPAQARKAGGIGYVPQSEDVDWAFPLSVRDVVMMGRYGHMGCTRRPAQGRPRRRRRGAGTGRAHRARRPADRAALRRAEEARVRRPRHRPGRHHPAAGRAVRRASTSVPRPPSRACCASSPPTARPSWSPPTTCTRCRSSGRRGRPADAQGAACTGDPKSVLRPENLAAGLRPRTSSGPERP